MEKKKKNLPALFHISTHCLFCLVPHFHPRHSNWFHIFHAPATLSISLSREGRDRVIFTDSFEIICNVQMTCKAARSLISIILPPQSNFPRKIYRKTVKSDFYLVIFYIWYLFVLYRPPVVPTSPFGICH